jgi:hypothetical protein
VIVGIERWGILFSFIYKDTALKWMDMVTHKLIIAFRVTFYRRFDIIRCVSINLIFQIFRFYIQISLFNNRLLFIKWFPFCLLDNGYYFMIAVHFQYTNLYVLKQWISSDSLTYSFCLQKVLHKHNIYVQYTSKMHLKCAQKLTGKQSAEQFLRLACKKQIYHIRMMILW